MCCCLINVVIITISITTITICNICSVSSVYRHLFRLFFCYGLLYVRRLFSIVSVCCSFSVRCCCCLCDSSCVSIFLNDLGGVLLFEYFQCL